MQNVTHPTPTAMTEQQLEAAAADARRWALEATDQKGKLLFLKIALELEYELAHREVAAGWTEIGGKMDELSQALGAPKRIVRDEEGRITGMQSDSARSSSQAPIESLLVMLEQLVVGLAAEPHISQQPK